jgi:hypothetical protein
VQGKELGLESEVKNPTTATQLMDLPNQWADGEDYIYNDRGHSDDGGVDKGRYDRNSNRQMKSKNCMYDEIEYPEVVAEIFLDKRDNNNGNS